MATNPMKRREHNAFLVGIIIGLILVLVVGFVMYKLYSDKRKEFETYKASIDARKALVVVAMKDIKSGTELNKDDFDIQEVIVDFDTTDNCFLSLEEMFEEESKDDSEVVYNKHLVARLDIPEGGIVMKNLVEDKDNAITADVRIQEYNSFLLPSELEAGDIIDVRMTLPNGQDYVVLSKKEVIKTDATTVWFNVNEIELQLMNSAMVESWTITGSKLYAIEYVDAGMQENAAVTYQPSAEVANIIDTSPNVVNAAKEALAKNLNSSSAGERRNDINDILKEYIDERDSAVESGFTNEATSIKQHRSEYIEALGE